MGKRPRPTALWDYKHHLDRVANEVSYPVLLMEQQNKAEGLGFFIFIASVV